MSTLILETIFGTITTIIASYVIYRGIFYYKDSSGNVHDISMDEVKSYRVN